MVEIFNKDKWKLGRRRRDADHSAPTARRSRLAERRLGRFLIRVELSKKVLFCQFSPRIHFQPLVERHSDLIDESVAITRIQHPLTDGTVVTRHAVDKDERLDVLSLERVPEPEQMIPGLVLRNLLREVVDCHVLRFAQFDGFFSDPQLNVIDFAFPEICDRFQGRMTHGKGQAADCLVPGVHRDVAAVLRRFDFGTFLLLSGQGFGRLFASQITPVTGQGDVFLQFRRKTVDFFEETG